MTFYAEEIDVCPAYGWVGGPNIDILIQSLRNKHEQRNWEDDVVLHSYTLPFQNVADPDYLAYIKSAYMALGGPLHSFLCKDFGDFRHGANNLETDPAMSFGVGTGAQTAFFLSKKYEFGLASYTRLITKPVAGATFYVNGVLTAATLNTLTGQVTFAVAPANGAIISWKGEFRVPVRFTDFFLPSTIDTSFSNGEKAVSGSCSLIEVLGE